MPDAAVVDASCLIVLARAGRLDLLRDLGPRIVVPGGVVNEVRAHPDAAAETISEQEWIEVVPDPAVPAAVAGWDLGLGESVVLAGALEQGGLAVIDDFAARQCAKVLGVAVLGTLGLVLRAKRAGRIPEARPVVDSLRGAGLFLSDALVRAALALVGE